MLWLTILFFHFLKVFFGALPQSLWGFGGGGCCYNAVALWDKEATQINLPCLDLPWRRYVTLRTVSVFITTCNYDNWGLVDWSLLRREHLSLSSNSYPISHWSCLLSFALSAPFCLFVFHQASLKYCIGLVTMGSILVRQGAAQLCRTNRASPDIRCKFVSDEKAWVGLTHSDLHQSNQLCSSPLHAPGKRGSRHWTTNPDTNLARAASLPHALHWLSIRRQLFDKTWNFLCIGLHRWNIKIMLPCCCEHNVVI